MKRQTSCARWNLCGVHKNCVLDLDFYFISVDFFLNVTFQPINSFYGNWILTRFVSAMNRFGELCPSAK